MRVAVYGGGFHPPHVGHAMVAAWLKWTDLVDEVWLTPAAHHAFGKELAPFGSRVRWCEALADAVGSWVRVDPIEASLPAPSYTLNTLRALQERHLAHTFRLVIGSDNLLVAHKWHRWEEITTQFDPIVVGRQGYAGAPGVVTFPAVSSTDIRARLAAGEPVGHLVPHGVLVAMHDMQW